MVVRVVDAALAISDVSTAHFIETHSRAATRWLFSSGLNLLWIERTEEDVRFGRLALSARC